VHPDRHEFLRFLERRVSCVQTWLAERRRVGEHDLDRFRACLAMLRQAISQARRGTAQEAQDALAQARAALEDMEREYEAPLGSIAPRREELRALRHHVWLTATLLPSLSNLDDPHWRRAHDMYERSWEEVHRAFEERRGVAP
jgi:hypothetical protein